MTLRGGMDLVSFDIRYVTLPITFMFPGHRGGVFAIHLQDPPEPILDPFELSSDSPLSSPSSSEEELYNKLALQEPIAPQPMQASTRRPAPPPPSRSSKPQPQDTP